MSVLGQSDLLLCCQSPEHATPGTLRYMPVAKNFLLGDKACSLSRMSNKYFQSTCSKSLTGALYYTAMDLCASIPVLCSCHGLYLTCKWQYVAWNASFFYGSLSSNSMTFRWKDNWRADGIPVTRSLLKESACLNGVTLLPIIPNTAQA